MASKLKLFFVFSVFIFLNISQAQSIDKIFERISNKISEDNTYLNLYYVDLYLNLENELNNFTKIPLVAGGEISFQASGDAQKRYRIIYLPENIEFDTLTILIIKELSDQTQQGAGMIGAGGIKTQEKVVLNFVDVQNLYYNHNDIYDLLLNKTEELIGNGGEYKLINQELFLNNGLKKSKGITASDNEDFLNFNWANNFHFYPKIQQSSGLDSLSDREKAKYEKDFILDVNLDHITFFHKSMKFKENSISFEANTVNPLLNNVPWANMSLSSGLRILIVLSSGKKDLLKDFIIDAKILGRFPINTSTLSEKLPFVFVDNVALNTTTGVEIELATSRFVGFPFLRIYYSTGADNFDNPYVKFGVPDSAYAYFTVDQWFATMSFFWNTNELRNLRLKMELGIGRHNVKKVTYLNILNLENVKNNMSPYVMFNMTFVPDSRGGELFSTSIRYYDNIIKLDFWLKLLALDRENNNVLRLTATHISKPILRGLKEWEGKGSTFIGINYRWGF